MTNVEIELDRAAVRETLLNSPEVKEYMASLADAACERFGYKRTNKPIESHGSGQRVWVKVESLKKEG